MNVKVEKCEKMALKGHVLQQCLIDSHETRTEDRSCAERPMIQRNVYICFRFGVTCEKLLFDHHVLFLAMAAMFFNGFLRNEGTLKPTYDR